MNVDARIKALSRPDERYATYEIRAELADIKQLIRDVLQEIKPNRGINRPPGINIGGNFINQGSLSVDPRSIDVWNAVIDEMEAKIKDIGL